MNIFAQAHNYGVEQALLDLNIDPESFVKEAAGLNFLKPLWSGAKTVASNIGKGIGHLTGFGAPPPGALRAGTNSMMGNAGRVATPGAVKIGPSGAFGVAGGDARQALALKGQAFREARQAARAAGPVHGPTQLPPAPTPDMRASVRSTRAPSPTAPAAAASEGAQGYWAGLSPTAKNWHLAAGSAAAGYAVPKVLGGNP